tara:strand:- start:304 stop:966 length:663 start_codon:yes stop_codon:yes gene_type:complete
MIKTQAYVITISHNKKSLEAARRCAESAREFNIECHHWEATTPKDNIVELFQKKGIDSSRFNEQYSRLENCMSAFYSHHSLWEKCVELNHEITIFEHDAVVTDRIPDFIKFKGCINLGEPSYGKFKNPNSLGVNRLTSKPYFPGAHAYRITVSGAKKLIESAKTKAEPTDIFLRLENFPWLEEYYPWPVRCKDTFTTIQHEAGCAAKHGYNEGYIIERDL